MSQSGPQIVDLGQKSGDLVLFGGCYSNYAALEALLDQAKTRGIADHNLICTGDIAGYCADTAKVTACFRARPDIALIAGNVEVQLADGGADCGCGFADGSQCDLASRIWFAEATRQLQSGDQRWMAGLPQGAVFEHSGKRYGVLHGGWSDISLFLWPNSEEALFADEIARFERAAGPVDGVIAGHCGLAFERHVAGRHWINAGVIGMPPHDGGRATRFAVLGEDGVRISKLDYDANASQRAMQQAGLTQGYEHALATGYWPSEDILPNALRR